MIGDLSIKGIENLIEMRTDFSMVQLLEEPKSILEVDCIKQIEISDGVYKHNRTFLIGKAIPKQHTLRKFMLLSIHLNKQKDKDGVIIIDDFNILNSQVDYLIGMPIDYKIPKYTESRDEIIINPEISILTELEKLYQSIFYYSNYDNSLDSKNKQENQFSKINQPLLEKRNGKNHQDSYSDQISNQINTPQYQRITSKDEDQFNQYIRNNYQTNCLSLTNIFSKDEPVNKDKKQKLSSLSHKINDISNINQSKDIQAQKLHSASIFESKNSSESDISINKLNNSNMFIKPNNYLQSQEQITPQSHIQNFQYNPYSIHQQVLDNSKPFVQQQQCAQNQSQQINNNNNNKDSHEELIEQLKYNNQEKQYVVKQPYVVEDQNEISVQQDQKRVGQEIIGEKQKKKLKQQDYDATQFIPYQVDSLKSHLIHKNKSQQESFIINLTPLIQNCDKYDQQETAPFDNDNDDNEIQLLKQSCSKTLEPSTIIYPSNDTTKNASTYYSTIIDINKSHLIKKVSPDELLKYYNHLFKNKYNELVRSQYDSNFIKQYQPKQHLKKQQYQQMNCIQISQPNQQTKKINKMEVQNKPFDYYTTYYNQINQQNNEEKQTIKSKETIQKSPIQNSCSSMNQLNQIPLYQKNQQSLSDQQINYSQSIESNILSNCMNGHEQKQPAQQYYLDNQTLSLNSSILSQETKQYSPDKQIQSDICISQSMPVRIELKEFENKFILSKSYPVIDSNINKQVIQTNQGVVDCTMQKCNNNQQSRDIQNEQANEVIIQVNKNKQEYNKKQKKIKEKERSRGSAWQRQQSQVIQIGGSSSPSYSTHYSQCDNYEQQGIQEDTLNCSKQQFQTVLHLNHLLIDRDTKHSTHTISNQDSLSDISNKQTSNASNKNQFIQREQIIKSNHIKQEIQIDSINNQTIQNQQKLYFNNSIHDTNQTLHNYSIVDISQIQSSSRKLNTASDYKISPEKEEDKQQMNLTQQKKIIDASLSQEKSSNNVNNQNNPNIISSLIFNKDKNINNLEIISKIERQQDNEMALFKSQKSLQSMMTQSDKQEYIKEEYKSRVIQQQNKLNDIDEEEDCISNFTLDDDFIEIIDD